MDFLTNSILNQLESRKEPEVQDGRANLPIVRTGDLKTQSLRQVAGRPVGLRHWGD